MGEKASIPANLERWEGIDSFPSPALPFIANFTAGAIAGIVRFCAIDEEISN